MKTQAATAEVLEDREFLDDVLEGLAAPSKYLQAKYFYDDIGSRIYSEITQLPEYYPTRTETGLMQEIRSELATECHDRQAVVEFGSGSGRRSEILLEALGTVRSYVPIDVSMQLLEDTRAVVGKSHPSIKVRPLLADFLGDYTLPAGTPEPRLGYFPGSTVGNFLPGESRNFLAKSRQVLGVDAQLLIGTDLVKPVELLEAAYDDAAGVTARFNKNLLVRINRELNADFDVSTFDHRADYNPALQRMEMRLVSRVDQVVNVAGIRHFRFREGESIHTENSHKFTLSGFQNLAAEAGWKPVRHWMDDKQWFGIHLLSAA